MFSWYKCKMSKEFLKFGKVEIKKQKFHSLKRAISIDDINIDNIIISGKIPCSKKCSMSLVGYEIIKKLHRCVSSSHKLVDIWKM